MPEQGYSFFTDSETGQRYAARTAKSLQPLCGKAFSLQSGRSPEILNNGGRDTRKSIQAKAEVKVI